MHTPTYTSQLFCVISSLLTSCASSVLNQTDALDTSTSDHTLTDTIIPPDMNTSEQVDQGLPDQEIICGIGETNCNNRCVDLTSDSSNCNSCGRQCLFGQFCREGMCMIECGSRD